jgi:hypothetical protein
MMKGMTMTNEKISPQNDIDLLMSLDPLNYTSKDIDVIIQYHRNQRAAKESGGLRKARKDTGPKTEIDLTKLGLKPMAPKINRRV